MRWPILAILAVSHPALADGAYLSESLGGASFQGDLARFGSAPRVALGAGYLRGRWGLEVFGAGVVPDLFFIDCYGEECASAAAAPTLGVSEFGVDVRRTWRVLYSTWTSKLGLDFVLHGGPRYFVATDALAGYRGIGIGGGAAIDLDLAVFSMFVDFSTDVLELHGDGQTYVGKIPSVMVGGRIGWM